MRLISIATKIAGIQNTAVIKPNDQSEKWAEEQLFRANDIWRGRVVVTRLLEEHPLDRFTCRVYWNELDKLLVYIVGDPESTRPIAMAECSINEKNEKYSWKLRIMAVSRRYRNLGIGTSLTRFIHRHLGKAMADELISAPMLRVLEKANAIEEDGRLVLR